MALWQYTFHILPNSYLESFSQNGVVQSDGLLDDDLFWREEHFHFDTFQDIGQILPKGKSWSNDICIYGDIESTCFEILVENEIVVSVSFRIDFTTNYEQIVNQIIEFSLLSGLFIVDEKFKVVYPNFLAVRDIIENCPQQKKYKKLYNS